MDSSNDNIPPDACRNLSAYYYVLCFMVLLVGASFSYLQSCVFLLQVRLSECRHLLSSISLPRGLVSPIPPILSCTSVAVHPSHGPYCCPASTPPSPTQAHTTQQCDLMYTNVGDELERNKIQAEHGQTCHYDSYFLIRLQVLWCTQLTSSHCRCSHLVS